MIATVRRTAHERGWLRPWHYERMFRVVLVENGNEAPSSFALFPSLTVE